MDRTIKLISNNLHMTTYLEATIILSPLESIV